MYVQNTVCMWTVQIWLWCKTLEFIPDNFSRQNTDFGNIFFIKIVLNNNNKRCVWCKWKMVCFAIVASAIYKCEGQKCKNTKTIISPVHLYGFETLSLILTHSQI